MSAENVEIVRRAVEVFNEFGFDGFGTSDLITDDIEFHEPLELRDGKIARRQAFWDKRRALEPAGLSE
jgi:hypothetical protein